MNTNEAHQIKTLYALSTVFTTMEVIIEGEARTLKSKVGFIKVFDTIEEAKLHQTDNSRILEVIVS